MGGLTVREASRKFNLDRSTIRALIKNQLIKAERVEFQRGPAGFAYVVDEQSLQDYLTTPGNTTLAHSLKMRKAYGADTKVTQKLQKSQRAAEAVTAPTTTKATKDTKETPGPTATKKISRTHRAQYITIPADLIPLEQAAVEAGCSLTTLYYRIREGALTGYRQNGQSMVSQKALKKALNGNFKLGKLNVSKMSKKELLTLAKRLSELASLK